MVAAPKSKKQKTKRDNTENNGLKKEFFSKIKQEYHDIDYADKLNKRQKRYLSKFMNESLGANLNSKNPLHKTKKLKKAVFDANNSRNRDIWSIHKALGRISLYTSSEEALEWWDNANNSHDEESWLAGGEKYEDAAIFVYYNTTSNELFSIQFRDDGKYTICFTKRSDVIDRKTYLEILGDENVIKIDELTFQEPS